MKLKAMCLTISNNSGTSVKTGKPYSINELHVIDVDAEKPEVLRLNIHDNDLAEARTLPGKNVVLELFHSNGNFRFAGAEKLSSVKPAANG